MSVYLAVEYLDRGDPGTSIILALLAAVIIAVTCKMVRALQEKMQLDSGRQSWLALKCCLLSDGSDCLLFRWLSPAGGGMVSL